MYGFNNQIYKIEIDEDNHDKIYNATNKLYLKILYYTIYFYSFETDITDAIVRALQMNENWSTPYIVFV